MQNPQSPDVSFTAVASLEKGLRKSWVPISTLGGGVTLLITRTAEIVSFVLHTRFIQIILLTSYHFCIPLIPSICNQVLLPAHCHGKKREKVGGEDKLTRLPYCFLCPPTSSPFLEGSKWGRNEGEA